MKLLSTPERCSFKPFSIDNVACGCFYTRKTLKAGIIRFMAGVREAPVRIGTKKHQPLHHPQTLAVKNSEKSQLLMIVKSREGSTVL